MGTGYFPGVKRSRRGVDYPPPTSAEVKERIELYIYSTFEPSCPILLLPLALQPAVGFGLSNNTSLLDFRNNKFFTVWGC